MSNHGGANKTYSSNKIEDKFYFNLDITLGSRYPNSDTEAFRYPNKGGGLGIRTSSDKICSDNESLKGGSRYPNSDKSYKNSDTEEPRYPNRSGGLGIRTSSDRICLIASH